MTNLDSERSQGDLISREALKEDLAKEIQTNDMGLWLKILLVIDNAQAVECPQFNILCENADEQAIADMRAELKRVLDEIRPKGEWIDDSPTSWKCSCCRYGVSRWNNTPFCPNCGACMKKDSAEQ